MATEKLKLLNVTRYTRAGKGGKDIICPICDRLSGVAHFRWASHRCPHCKNEVKKPEWLIRLKIKSKPTRCKLCGRSTIYESKIEHPYYREPGTCYWCGFVQADWALIASLAEPIGFQCPWHIPFKGRCPQVTVFTPEQLTNRYTYGCYGASPYHYPDMTKACPVCGHLADMEDFVLNNIDVFRATKKVVEVKLV